MATFLFWNLRGLRREQIVARIARDQDVDVVLLAECNVPEDQRIAALSGAAEAEFRKPWSPPGKIEIFTRFSPDLIRPVFDDPAGRLTIRQLIVNNHDMLLAAVHFQSKVNWSDDDQREECQNLARHIREVEEDRGHCRTVLVGDLNMNPFDSGVISSHGLHGVMTRNLAKQLSRRVAGNDYPFFYNPMWGSFGDRTDGPAGTHYFRAAKPLIYFWNMYDQVLIRPELLKAFQGELQILDSIGSTPLVTKSGLPDKKTGSDHLPVIFRLHL